MGLCKILIQKVWEGYLFRSDDECCDEKKHWCCTGLGRSES